MNVGTKATLSLTTLVALFTLIACAAQKHQQQGTPARDVEQLRPSIASKATEWSKGLLEMNSAAIAPSAVSPSGDVLIIELTFKPSLTTETTDCELSDGHCLLVHYDTVMRKIAPRGDFDRAMVEGFRQLSMQLPTTQQPQAIAVRVHLGQCATLYLTPTASNLRRHLEQCKDWAPGSVAAQSVLKTFDVGRFQSEQQLRDHVTKEITGLFQDTYHAEVIPTVSAGPILRFDILQTGGAPVLIPTAKTEHLVLLVAIPSNCSVATSIVLTVTGGYKTRLSWIDRDDDWIPIERNPQALLLLLKALLNQLG